jgi:aminoglycoside 3-N-acetyltransferase
MTTVPIDLLTREWREAGLGTNDIVLIHSSVKRTLRRYLKAGHRLDTADILQSFLQAVGPGGTVLFPLFNFDFTTGVPFDIRTTPSRMGALSEAARLHPGAVRTGHPIYSFAVIGAEARRFDGVENFSGYGPDSPFAMLRALDGKIAVLGLPDQHSMTFYHHVEEAHEVPYRYHKTFTADYTGRDGGSAPRTFGLFVRDIEKGVMTAVDPMGERLWADGLYAGHRPDAESGLRVIGARVLFDAVGAVIQAGAAQGLLYRIEPGR